MFPIFFIVYNVSAMENFWESNIVRLFIIYLLLLLNKFTYVRVARRTILAWDAWNQDYHDAHTSHAEDGQLAGAACESEDTLKIIIIII